MLLFSFINIIDSHLSNNGAQFYGGIMYMSQTFSKISDSTFSHNIGSLHVLNSNLSFNGLTLFENCAEPPNKGAIGEVLIYISRRRCNHKLFIPHTL